MEPELIITIISLTLTTLMSVSSIILPFIMRHKDNKLKSKEKAIDFLHETIYDFVKSYAQFRENSCYVRDSLSGIYKIMTFCSESTKEKLKLLSQEITKNHISYQTCDSIFFECVSVLQKEFSLKSLHNK